MCVCAYVYVYITLGYNQRFTTCHTAVSAYEQAQALPGIQIASRSGFDNACVHYVLCMCVCVCICICIRYNQRVFKLRVGHTCVTQTPTHIHSYIHACMHTYIQIQTSTYHPFRHKVGQNIYDPLGR